MRIAAFFYQDQPHVGLVVSRPVIASLPLTLPLADRELGALTLGRCVVSR
jgi:hypothetical protein